MLQAETEVFPAAVAKRVDPHRKHAGFPSEATRVRNPENFQKEFQERATDAPAKREIDLVFFGEA